MSRKKKRRLKMSYTMSPSKENMIKIYILVKSEKADIKT